MKLGILGLPGSGKSTLFDLLTENFEGTDWSVVGNKPRIKNVKVRDPRLERLRDDFSPRKYTPASFDLYDFPAARKEGDRGGLADLLAPARGLEALFVVLRAFDSPGCAAVDVARDLEEVRGELILADLVVVERRLERLEAKSRKPNFSDDDARERQILGRIHESLDEERLLSGLELTADEQRRISGFGFLCAKPLVVVANVADGGADLPLESLAAATGGEAIAISARDELEILQLPEADQSVFLQEYGIEELSRDLLISRGYRAAGSISFFTAGEKEVKAWTIRRGASAVEAAGEIHSDIARGFIRAETVSFEDYVEHGGHKGARDKGLLRLEGKEYAVRDGDIIEFRFSV